jgi:hypothetical protein
MTFNANIGLQNGLESLPTDCNGHIEEDMKSEKSAKSEVTFSNIFICSDWEYTNQYKDNSWGLSELGSLALPYLSLIKIFVFYRKILWIGL